MMNRAIEHRGPDDNGIWISQEKTFGFSHNRLSILDLSSAGHQPMEDKNFDNIISYNGEIFNYLDINRREFLDETFSSDTDTETVLKLYKKYELGMLNMLDGMFALAIWNGEELILARDKSGKKPLYYTEKNGQFIFASEIKSILALPYILGEIDNKAVYDFLTYNIVPFPNTMFKGIYKFSPGHYMRINNNGIKDYSPYYTLKKKRSTTQMKKTYPIRFSTQHLDLLKIE